MPKHVSKVKIAFNILSTIDKIKVPTKPSEY